MASEQDDRCVNQAEYLFFLKLRATTHLLSQAADFEIQPLSGKQDAIKNETVVTRLSA
jgi:hypothetical protein